MRKNTTEESHESVERERIAFVDVADDDSIENVGLVAVDEDGKRMPMAPTGRDPGRYELVRVTEDE